MRTKEITLMSIDELDNDICDKCGEKAKIRFGCDNYYLWTCQKCIDNCGMSVFTDVKPNRENKFYKRKPEKCSQK